MTDAERYFALVLEMRESDEAILKKHGLKWRDLDALEQAATEEMIAANQDVRELSKKYVAMLYKKPIFIRPGKDIGGVSYSIRIKQS